MDFVFLKITRNQESRHQDAKMPKNNQATKHNKVQKKAPSPPPDFLRRVWCFLRLNNWNLFDYCVLIILWHLGSWLLDASLASWYLGS
jgi:hypothetical protein